MGRKSFGSLALFLAISCSPVFMSCDEEPKEEPVEEFVHLYKGCTREYPPFLPLRLLDDLSPPETASLSFGARHLLFLRGFLREYGGPVGCREPVLYDRSSETQSTFPGLSCTDFENRHVSFQRSLFVDAAISANGEYVVYVAAPPNPNQKYPESLFGIWVLERSTGMITPLPPFDNYQSWGGVSPRPTISNDGRYVAFTHVPVENFHLVTHVFDRQANAYLDLGGSNGGLDGEHPYISANGQYVALIIYLGGIQVFDIQAKKYLRLPGIQGSGGGPFVHYPTLSFDARFLLWGSCCREGDGIKLYDRKLGRMVPLPGLDEIISGSSDQKLVISPDGRYIFVGLGGILPPDHELSVAAGKRVNLRDYCLYDRGPASIE